MVVTRAFAWMSTSRAVSTSPSTSVAVNRCDISEELARLDAHLLRYESLLHNEAQEESVGRNLEFLIQEFLREINTICSKSRETDVIIHALDMKAAVERMRAQGFNACDVLTLPDLSGAALPLYLSAGFVHAAEWAIY